MTSLAVHRTEGRLPEVHEKLEDVTLAALDQWRRKNLNHETGPSFTEANVPDLPADA